MHRGCWMYQVKSSHLLEPITEGLVVIQDRTDTILIHCYGNGAGLIGSGLFDSLAWHGMFEHLI